MMYVTNPFCLPLLFMVWVIELYLFAAFIRLVMTQIPTARQSNLYQQIRLLTDFMPEAVAKRLPKGKEQPSPTWLAWLIVLVSGIILRHLLIIIITT